MMEDLENSRKNFIKLFTKSIGSTLANHPILGALTENSEVLKLSTEQQEFMLKYGIWMDQNIAQLKLMKTEPDNLENHKKMMELAEEALLMQPQLIEYMKDRTFGLIYHASIQKMKEEIT